MIFRRRLRIVLQVDHLKLGGLEKKVANLALRLDRRRFEPVVSWQGWGELGELLYDAGVPLIRIRAQQETVEQMAARLKELRAVIYHSFRLRKNEFDVLVAAKAGVPRIVTNRANVRHWDPHMRVQPWEIERNARTHAITACCQAVASVCCRVEQQPAEKVAVLYNGVPLPAGVPGAGGIRAELDLVPGTLVLGYTAAYRTLKAHDVLLAAFAKVLRAHPRTHLICCGRVMDQECAALPDLAARLGIARSVSLLDARRDVASVYRDLDLYVHPSRSEGFSNSVLEAMAHGLPVVATAVGGTAEAVEDGVTGLLVPPRDEDALAAAIVRLLSNRDERRRMGREGRARAEQKFSIDAMIQAYARFYEGLAS